MNRNQALMTMARRKSNASLQRHDVIGAWIATPQFLKEQTQSLDAEIRSLDEDMGKIRASWGPVTQPSQMEMDRWWNANWIPFLKARQSFYDDHGATWGARNWYENFWGSPVWDGLNDFRRRLKVLYDSSKAVGYRLTAPTPTTPKQGYLDEAMSSLGSMFKTAFYAILIGGLVVALIWVWKR